MDERGGALGPLGILGGGQLARMTIQAASNLGIDCVVAERFAGSPAARLTACDVVFPGTWDDLGALARLAALAPTVTLESEFVDAAILRQLEAHGARVLPGPESVALIQDKLRQKHTLAEAGLPVAAFRSVERAEDAEALGAQLGWPLVLKARRDSYDGYGNALVAAPSDLEAAMRRLGWPERGLFAEALVPFERELATMVVRGRSGEVVVYPVVETCQDAERHICRVVLAPARVPRSVAEQAASTARRAVEVVDGVGAFGVEMFLLADGGVLVNEMAPRPHNSGHFSIQACETSQFANHVRAVLDLPLGRPTMRAPAAAMVNLLGTGGPGPTHADFAAALAVPESYVHVYGKRESRAGRKMGHVTALGDSLDDALERAQRVASHLRL